jgi:GNAT superfamily N-acetyltransferase
VAWESARRSGYLASMRAAIRIREAEPADVELILEFIRGLAEYEKLTKVLRIDPQGFHDHLFGERRYCEALIGELEGAAAGYALYFHTYSTFLTKPGIWLEDLFVLPEHRGSGVGRALLRHVAAIGESRGCGRLEWSVLDWNEPAIRFYRSIGAAPVDGWTMYRLDGDALARFARET